MKKLICFLMMTLFLIITISGCNDIEEEDNGVSKVLTDVYSIKIADVAADMYSSPLQYSLTESEVKELIDALRDSPEKQTSFTGYLYYSFELYDKDGKFVDKISLDTQKTLKFDSGKTIERTEKMNSILKTIEQKYNITLDIWDRKPGNEYFSLFNLVDHGQIYEITENNFVEGLRVDLSRTKCSDISNQIDSISFSNSIIESIDKKYVFEFYSVDGGTIYILYLDKSGEIFTEQGYKIDCDSLNAKLTSLIVK